MDEFKPKVFISYSWTNNDYVLKVTNFVNRLVADGVDVLFDQYEIKPGKSLNNYMERCVKDPTITNVLILLNPDYKEKADAGKGGIGIETQIISSEVYQNLNNEKFIPILFDKMGKDVSSCVPVYLKDRYRLDLSEETNYENMYMTILRTIYKKPAFVKPAIGKKPAWLDNKNDELYYDISEIAKIREMIQKKDKNLKKYVSSMLHKELLEIPFSKLKLGTCEDFESSYSNFFKFRNQFIASINEIIEEEYIEDLLFDFFEDFDSFIKVDTADLIARNKYLKIFKHELIIEVISILFTNKKYSTIGSLIGRTYISGENYECQDFIQFFYCMSDKTINILEEDLIKKYNNKNMQILTGIGDFWINHLPEPFVNRDDFSFADVLISNLSIAIVNNFYAWFALTYVYRINENNELKKMAASIKSRKLATNYLSLFECKEISELKIKINNIKKFDESKAYRFGYAKSFDTIDLISKYIEIEEVGSLS